MAMQPYTGASSSMVSSRKYDVFISFRGEDTRRKFTSHLYDILRKYFRTFIDENELEKGDEISSALIKAIEEAYVSVVVFSKDYASSKWCLNELLKILECKKEQGQIVIPVFYDVDPSHVRNQRGSYEQAFEKHERDLRHNKDKLQKWRNALTEAANLSGWDSRDDRNESNFIKDIVKDVLKKLYRRHPIEVNKELVGIEKKNNEVESLMKIGSNDVKTLGLWGMDGIGKTTLAKYVYANQFSQFERFMENVREEYKLFLSALSELPFELLCWDSKHPEEEYKELFESAIGYCTGNPLALKVFSANFRTKCKEVLESELKKLKKIPNGRIHDVLKLSFNYLDRTQRGVFLDIACFGSRTSNIRGDFFAISGSEALIFLDHDSIQMHDLIVEMGREIVKQESPKDPGKRSRLWDHEEVYDVLKYNKGTEVVEVIFFDISKFGDVYLSSDSFKSMINLRYLHIHYEMIALDAPNNYPLHLLDGLEWLSDKLRHLHWDLFPLESLPSTFCAERLVILTMYASKLRKLWDGIQKLENLLEINLAGSKDLIEIPDLSRAPNLKKVDLSYCASLRQLHPSIFTSHKLEFLDLKHCKKLESLKTSIHSKSLHTLDLTDCSSLMEFSVTSEKMERLMLCGTAIHEFPSSMWLNRKLPNLNLSECAKLNIVGKKLSNDPGLGSLSVLNLSRCTQLNTSNLWLLLDGMPYLNKLCLRECCNLETLPDNIQNNSRLELLMLDECWNLESQQKLPVSLQQLTAVNCISLDTNSILENMIDRQRLQNSYKSKSNHLDHSSFLPGGQFPHRFHYHTTEASIVIPPILKSGLSCFIFCIIFSEGFYVTDDESTILCTIYENKKVVHDFVECVGASGTLISDHVLLFSLSSDEFKSVEQESKSGGNHYNFSFEFKHSLYDNKDEGSTKGIKGCGVFPVYGLGHNLGLDGRSNSRVEIVELQSSVQVSDELQHQAIGAELGGPSYENEDDQQQLLIPPKKRRRRRT